uniref:Uncharacterized protein n=1 Tax=Anguilla anguilla TaxID=7936 RepID=A0A0E9UMY8_ANGAN
MQSLPLGGQRSSPSAGRGSNHFQILRPSCQISYHCCD